MDSCPNIVANPLKIILAEQEIYLSDQSIVLAYYELL
jgi:hypothetical protein